MIPPTDQRAKNARSQAALIAAHAKARLRQVGMSRVSSFVVGAGPYALAFVLADYRDERLSAGIVVDGGRGTDPKTHAYAMVSDLLALLDIPRAALGSRP